MGAAYAGGRTSVKRRRRLRHSTPMSEINVTPFVDVMLVLLIVFMISAPLLTIGVPIDLPQTQANPLQSDQEPLTVSVDQAGTIFLQNSETEFEDLVPRLMAISEENLETRIFVRGDRTVDYGTVMRVMGALSTAGFSRIGLVTETEREQ